MPCGTGKTFAALRIVESIAGVGGRVLYLEPSIFVGEVAEIVGELLEVRGENFLADERLFTMWVV